LPRFKEFAGGADEPFGARPVLALLLLIGTTGMIISALQESLLIPANANGGDAKEPSDDGAFAALLFAAVAPPQSGSVAPAGEPAEGDSFETAAAPQISSAGGETQTPGAGNPSLNPTQMSAAETGDVDAPAIAQPTANPEEVAVRAPLDGKVAGEGQPIETEEKIEALPAKPSEPAFSTASAHLSGNFETARGRNAAQSGPAVKGLKENAQKTPDDSEDSSTPRQDDLAPNQAAQVSAAAASDPGVEIFATKGGTARLTVPLPASDDTAPEKTAETEALLPEPKKDSIGDEGEGISAGGDIVAAAPKNSAGRDALAPARSARAEAVLAARAAGEAQESAPDPHTAMSRGEEHKSIQGRIHEAVEAPANNPAPARAGAEQKSFDRDGRALPALSEEKNPPAKETRAAGGFSLESTVARQETQSRTEAEPINWRPTVERLAGDIVSRVHIGAREAILQLDPPELGKIKIDLRMDGDKLLAHIAADSPEAQSLLKNHLPELHQALQSQQINLAEVRVWSGRGAAGDFAQNFNQAPGQRQPGGWSAGGGAQGEHTAAQEPPRAQRFASGSGRVSVWA